VHTEALFAAQQLGADCDPAVLASIHGCLGITNWWLGNLAIAADELRHAFDENTRLGNAGGATLNVAVLGLVREAEGQYQEALDCQRRGLEIAREAGIQVLVATQLINLGYVHLRLEQYDVAAQLYQEAYDMFDEGDELSAIAHARYCLATAYEGLGRHDEALAHAEEALAINRSFGHLTDRIRVMDVVGSIYRRMGRLGEAVDGLTEALAMCREAHNVKMSAQLLNTLGETYRDAGEHTRAVDHHAEALSFAEQGGDRFEATRALIGLGDAHACLGDAERARRDWLRALDACADMNLPAAARLRARLFSSTES
jgi:tetratricopeptide (TPR) repeat protein